MEYLDKEHTKGRGEIENRSFRGKSNYIVEVFAEHIMFYVGLCGHFALSTLLAALLKEPILETHTKQIQNTQNTKFREVNSNTKNNIRLISK